MRLAELIEASRQTSATRSRLAKTAALAHCLRRLDPAEIALGVAYLSGDTATDRLGVGYAALQGAWNVAPAAHPSLTLADVDAALKSVAAMQGGGSAAARRNALRNLFERATLDEQKFLGRLLLGELRQGALEGLMLDAVARASGLPVSALRSALMRAGSLPAVAQAALSGSAAALGGGAAALERFALSVFQPVQPMLAQSAGDISDALARLGRASFEWKIDGVRVQVHKAGSAVRAYSRSLNEVSGAVPEIIEAVRTFAADTLILDGEVVALGPDGTPRAFQDTMRRFGRKTEAAALREALPLSAFFFDCLLVDGRDLTAQPLERRYEALGRAVPTPTLMPRLLTGEAAAAQAFMEDCLRQGHEGAMAKSLGAPYEGGSRGSAWLKIKKAHTLDLAVLAVEWGSGRRSGWLSNLHLGAHDRASGGFVMLGKTFKGMTDEMLRWQTERLLALETRREGAVVHVRPELVVEIAFNEIQASRQYPGGLALRFARVKRYREDKRAQDADSIETVRALYEAQKHRQASSA